MSILSRRAYAFAVLALAVVMFFAVNIFADAAFTSARIDLTADSAFTLAPGTRDIIEKLNEPVTLKFYYSKKVAAQYATTAAYAKRVRDLLAEYAALSHGKIRLLDVDPEPYTPEEDEATAAGLTGAPTDSGDTVYFGLVGTNSLDGKQTIAYFTNERAPYLEYDISSLVYRLSTPKPPVLGIISTLPLTSGSETGQPLAIYTELGQDYRTVNIDPGAKVIPPDVDVLLIAHPVGLGDDTLAAIDQFVLKGGHALVFVDPVSELMNHASGGAMRSPPASSLGPLLASWGVDYDPNKVLADRTLAQEVRASADSTTTISYPLWLHLTPDDFDLHDPVTANLQSLNLASTGALIPLKGATTNFLPLLRSSNRAALLPRAEAMSTPDPGQLMASLATADHRYTIAARITGPAATAYPGRPGLAHSAGPIAVIVMADSDIFDDRYWVREENMLGRTIAEPFADNGAFVQGAVENLFGSEDLISLRTRGTSQRPFTVVQALQAQAQNQYQETAQALRTRLNATQQQLRQLQQGEQQGKAGGVGLTDEQKGDIRRFQHELVDTRAQLRDVQHNLRKDIDTLGGILAFINIGLVPILVAGLALLLGFRRRRPRAKA